MYKLNTFSAVEKMKIKELGEVMYENYDKRIEFTK